MAMGIKGEMLLSEMSTETLYRQYRPLIFSLAYRMTGSRTEAEDVVHDVFLQWSRRGQDRSAPEHPKAYLCRMAVHHCTDLARSARARRETYVGPWLPEPLLATDVEDDPAAAAERSETLSFAMLLLMERLSPVERAVFVLREAFGFEYPEIAAMVGKSTENARKIMSRVRAKLDGERALMAAPEPGFAEQLLQAFQLAERTGDLEPLFRRLAPDAVLLSDGGGKAVAAAVPVVSRPRVAAFLAGISRNLAADAVVLPTVINGSPAIAALEGPDREVRSLLTFRIGADGSIQAVYIVRNPDKLRHVSEWLRIG